MTDIDTTTSPDTGGDATRLGQAKQAIGQAGQALKSEAQSFADAAAQRAREEAQRRTETATRTLGDFASAIRKAGDELGQTDQSPAARLVRQAADGLEGLATNLAGKQPEDLLNDVRAFGRRNPIAFIGGAVLVGVALGRFIRASETGGAVRQALTDETGGDAYPIADAPAYGAEASGLESAIGDDLGDLQPADVTDATETEPTRGY